MSTKVSIVFNGECLGVHIDPRGENDPHAVISILVEDDETWFKKFEFSSYWLPELIEQLNKANTYLKANAVPDLDSYGDQYGYNLKEGK